MSDARVGLTVVQSRYVSHASAHYGGSLVDGAFVLALFGDAATEVCLRSDGDEGLFAGYDAVTFLGPVRAGDVVEVRAEVDQVGSRSRHLQFSAVITCRATPEISDSAGAVLDPPLEVVRASGTVVVPLR